MNEEALTPVMVQNEHTKRFINVAPMLQLVNENYLGEFSKVAEEIDDCIKFFVTTADESALVNGKAFTSCVHSLFEFRDMFKNMAEYKEERR